MTSPINAELLLDLLHNPIGSFRNVAAEDIMRSQGLPPSLLDEDVSANKKLMILIDSRPLLITKLDGYDIWFAVNSSAQHCFWGSMQANLWLRLYHSCQFIRNWDLLKGISADEAATVLRSFDITTEEEMDVLLNNRPILPNMKVLLDGRDHTRDHTSVIVLLKSGISIPIRDRRLESGGHEFVTTWPATIRHWERHYSELKVIDTTSLSELERNWELL